MFIVQAFSFFFLFIAIAAVWLKSWPFLWKGCVFCSVFLAVFSGLVEWFGLTALASILAASWLAAKESLGLGIRRLALALVIVLAVVITFPLIPNHPFIVVSDAFISSMSKGYTLRYSYLNGMTGLILLASFVRLAETKREWRDVLRDALFVGFWVCLSLMGIALFVGYVRFDPKLPPIAPYWLLGNLFLTCVGEEAFFRGVLLEQFERAFSFYSGKKALALIASSFLFGLKHFKGGPLYVLLAGVAGLFYGAAYLRNRRIEASIGVHFILNSLHFFLFSYPAYSH